MRRHRPNEAECARKKLRFVYKIAIYRVSKTRATQNEKIRTSSNCLDLGICHGFHSDGKIRRPLNPIHRNFVHENGNPRDRAYIEEAHVVSRNTVKAHVKHVYAKLDIYSHQELIDLVED